MMSLNNIKEEFIKLIEFKESIEYKVKQLEELKPWSPSEIKVIDSQAFAYRAILWEIDQFMLEWADRERDLYYMNWDNENL